MDNFEDWFSSQDFYTNLRFIHGDALFLKDGDVYRVLVVRIASDAWQEQQKQIEGRDFTIAAMSRSLVLANAKVDELQARVDAVKQLIQEYRDPPTEDKTFCHALSIVAYELEQALKGESNESST